MKSILKFLSKIKEFLLKIKSRKILTVFYLVLLLASMSASLFFYLKYKKERVIILKPEMKIEKTSEVLSDKVNKLVRLAIPEEPNVFVINGNTPRNQPFLVEAKNGDVLLLYLKNKKAILYDPQVNQILKIGPLATSTYSAEINKAEEK